MTAVGLALMIGALAALRFADVRGYPMLEPDEGIWTFEARDAVLFHDRTMSGFPGMFLSPLHYGLLWLLFHVVPATCFSVRLLMGVVGLGSLALVFRLLARRYDARTATAAVVMIGFSFVMITTNRRAYLESPVMLLSLAAVWAATRATRARYLLMAGCVTLLVLYKSNAVYIVPALLVPEPDEAFRKGIARRLAAATCGVLAGLLVIFLISRISPDDAAAAFRFEMSKGTAPALVRLGRFRIAPAVVVQTLGTLSRQYTDLAFLTAVGLGAFVAARAWHDRFACRLVAWLLAGYAFLLVQWSHLQYFAPLIAPAGMLSAHALSRAGERWRVNWARRTPLAVVALGTAVFSVARAGAGWRQRGHDPPMTALRWLETQDLGPSALLAGPELVVATEKRGYAFSRIFHPLPPLTPPRLSEFVARHDVKLIVFDQWETAPYFAGETEFFAELSRYPRVAGGEGWTAYEVPHASPVAGPAPAPD